jgi:hypothetical protein
VAFVESITSRNRVKAHHLLIVFKVSDVATPHRFMASATVCLTVFLTLGISFRAPKVEPKAKPPCGQRLFIQRAKNMPSLKLKMESVEPKVNPSPLPPPSDTSQTYL